jgi:hypothetical protein
MIIESTGDRERARAHVSKPSERERECVSNFCQPFGTIEGYTFAYTPEAKLWVLK